MIKLSNVQKFQVNQTLGFKGKKENKQQQESNNTAIPEKFVSPNAEHLKANYLSFGARKQKQPLEDEFSEIGIENESNYEKEIGTELLDPKKLKKAVEERLNQSGRNIIKLATDIAIANQNPVVNHYHTYQAVLEDVNSYIEEVNSGSKRPEENTQKPKLVSYLEDTLDSDILKNKEKRGKFQGLIQSEMKVNIQNNIDTLPKIQSNKPVVDKDMGLYTDIWERYENLFSDDTANPESIKISDGSIIDALNYSRNNKVASENTMKRFYDVVENEFAIDHKPLEEKTHVGFYDETAQRVTTNLGLGKDVIVTFENVADSEHLFTSLQHTIKDKSKQIGDLKGENTDIILLDNPTLEFMTKLKTKLKESDKKTVVVIKSLDSFFNKTSNPNIEGTSGINPEVLMLFVKQENKNSGEDNSKVKFVCGVNKYSLQRYKQSPLVEAILGNFSEVAIPIPNETQTKEILKNSPALLKDVKKTFSPNAIDKCVDISSGLEGIYPRKAINLMKTIAKTYPEASDIHLGDVRKFEKEYLKWLKTEETSDEDKVIFDTGKKLNDIVGSDMTKAEAQEIVFQIKKGIIGTKGIVIHADTEAGGGRRHVAEAIAGEAKVPFIPVNGSDFSLKDSDMAQKGETPEVKIKKIFKTAVTQAEASPNKTAIIFVEGFDNLAMHPLMGYHPYEKKAFNQILLEMDNVRSNKNVNILVMGSSSHPSVHDPAIRKPGKFMDDIMVYSTTFDASQRVDILNYYIKKDHVKIAGKTSEEKQNVIKSIADSTEYASVVDLIQLLGKAQSVARTSKHKEGIDEKDFKEALLQIECGRPSSIENTMPSKRVTAGHECGHMLNGMFMNEWAEKNQKHWNTTFVPDFMTLDPRGWFAGMVCSNRSKNDESTKETLFASLVLSYGGYSVENQLFGIEGSSGISADIDMATIAAYGAVTRHGEGPATGRKSFASSEDLRNWYAKPIKHDMDVYMENGEIVSDMIVKAHKGFIEEFTDKYSEKVGSGKTIVTKQEFKQQLEEWKSRQTPEKQREIRELNGAIKQVMDSTRAGVVVDRDAYLNPEKQINKNDANDPYSIF